MLISDWSSDVCSSDLHPARGEERQFGEPCRWRRIAVAGKGERGEVVGLSLHAQWQDARYWPWPCGWRGCHRPFRCPRFGVGATAQGKGRVRSEEHSSELQSLMRISYDVLCLKKKKKTNSIKYNNHT